MLLKGTLVPVHKLFLVLGVDMRLHLPVDTSQVFRQSLSLLSLLPMASWVCYDLCQLLATSWELIPIACWLRHDQEGGSATLRSAFC